MPEVSSGLSTPWLYALGIAVPACIVVYLYFGFFAPPEQRDKWRSIVLVVPVVAAFFSFALGYGVGFTRHRGVVDQTTRMTRSDIGAEAREIERRAAALSRFANKDLGPQDKTKLAVELLTLENLARQLREGSE